MNNGYIGNSGSGPMAKDQVLEETEKVKNSKSWVCNKESECDKLRADELASLSFLSEAKTAGEFHTLPPQM